MAHRPDYARSSLVPGWILLVISISSPAAHHRSIIPLLVLSLIEITRYEHEQARR